MQRRTPKYGAPRTKIRTLVSQPSSKPISNAAAVTSTNKDSLSKTSDAHKDNPTSQPETQEDAFVWTKCWYPVTALDYLNPSVPMAITVLGFDLVVWKDNDNQWRCFRDSCPHRAAPLSEGSIHPTKGLQCAYHGFTFSGTGKCTGIPQSQGGAPLQSALSSPRSCAISYPTTTKHGLLWVWLESGEEAETTAAATPLPTMPTKDSNGVDYFQVSNWYIREMDVDYVALMENSADPSHVHWTHAGAIGSPDKAGPIDVSLVREGSDSHHNTNKNSDNSSSFEFIVDDPKKATFRNLKIDMPCTLWACSEGMEGGELGLLYNIVPVAPGRCRLMSLPVSTSSKFRFPAKIFHFAPFLRHLYNHQVAAQDIAILHRQGTNLAAEDFKGWKKGFYMPTGADKGILVLRKWLEKAGGGVKWGPNVDSTPIRQAVVDREALFNNYESHTKHCPSCSKALERVKQGVLVAKIVGVLSLVASVVAYVIPAAAGRAVLIFSVAGWAVVSLVSWLSVQALINFQGSFMQTHYRHSDNKKLVEFI
jgi:phenylpropionate dioxygenase-like ring-hydroxylating dioxygenase large terminal subunit